MTGARFVEVLSSDSGSNYTSDEEETASTSLSNDIYDEQLFNILKSFLMTSSGKPVVDVLQEIAKELAGLRIAIASRAIKE